MPELPPPLPPAERTVGQLIGETIRFYGERFWVALPLGIPFLVVDQIDVHRKFGPQLIVNFAAAPLVSAAFVYACALRFRVRPTPPVFALALLVYLPFPVLRALVLLPGIIWFAFIGLAVPAALVEHLDIRSALARGRQLGGADFVHALGSLAALVLVVGIAEETLTLLLRSQGDNSQRIALAIADLVLTPLLYLGGALLYVDQAARVGSGRPRPGRKQGRRRNADIHPALDSDAAGGADAQVEP